MRGRDVILTLSAPSGSGISLDFSNQLGESVELCCFDFVEPPIEFRLTPRLAIAGMAGGQNALIILGCVLT